MYAIIGQGLAGTVLAFHLAEMDIPFRIFDNGYQTSSSLVAAGMWNPIGFKRINTTWRAHEFMDSLQMFYPEIERRTDATFFHPTSLIRVHKSKWEVDTWFEKKNQPLYRNFLTDGLPQWPPGHFAVTPFRAHRLRGTGYVDTEEFLKVSRQWFQDKNLYFEEEIRLPDPSDRRIRFEAEGMRFDGIIDCRGAVSAQSNWWRHIPFKLTKGEVIHLHCPGLGLNEIYNSGFFIMPLGNDFYCAGSTYERDQLTPEPTAAARNELVHKLKRELKRPFEITGHVAGIRPTVRDRRPLLGVHPEISNLFLFNGLGSKGVMMAPALAKRFTTYLKQGEPLPDEIDIARFIRYYKPDLMPGA